MDFEKQILIPFPERDWLKIAALIKEASKSEGIVPPSGENRRLISRIMYGLGKSREYFVEDDQFDRLTIVTVVPA